MSSTTITPISVREAVTAVSNVFDREVNNYPQAFDREYVSSRGRSYGRGEAPWVYQNVYQVWTAQSQSRLLCAYNEFAICATENRVNYITGENGFGVQAVPKRETSGRGMRLAERVNQFIEAFEELNGIDNMISESMARLDTDGEFFVRLFYGKDALTRLRFVEPEHVYYNGGDTLNPRYSFGIENPENDVCEPVAYWIAQRPWESPVTTRIEQKYVTHCKLNAKSNQKRGWPSFLSVGPNLLRCEDLLGSMTQIARTRAKIALIRKLLNVSKDTATSLLEELTKRKETSVEGVNINIEDFQPGTILTSNDRTQYEFPDYKFGADDFVEVLQAELRTIAARFKMPEWMLTALADAKYNNAFVVESTATKEFSRLQRMLHKFWVLGRVGHRRSIYWRAIIHAIDMGLLPREVVTQIKLVCNGPVIVTRDKKVESEVNKTYYEMGLLDGDSIQRDQGIDPNDVNDARAVRFRDGTMSLPLEVVQYIQTTLGDIQTGKIPEKMGYQLISNVVGVPTTVVKEVYPVTQNAASSGAAISGSTPTDGGSSGVASVAPSTVTGTENAVGA